MGLIVRSLNREGIIQPNNRTSDQAESGNDYGRSAMTDHPCRSAQRTPKPHSNGC